MENFGFWKWTRMRAVWDWEILLEVYYSEMFLYSPICRHFNGWSLHKSNSSNSKCIQWDMTLNNETFVISHTSSQSWRSYLLYVMITVFCCIFVSIGIECDSSWFSVLKLCLCHLGSSQTASYSYIVGNFVVIPFWQKHNNWEVSKLLRKDPHHFSRSELDPTEINQTDGFKCPSWYLVSRTLFPRVFITAIDAAARQTIEWEKL